MSKVERYVLTLVERAAVLKPLESRKRSRKMSLEFEYQLCEDIHVI